MSTVATWPSQAESWLDQRGKGAWIAAMVLGFIFLWPVGLALCLYMAFTGKFRSGGRCARTTHHNFKSSGNTAFDAYKADTLRRLEDEQGSFEAFLERLRAAKDKAEFDEFMDERAKTARDTQTKDEKEDA